ncbi:hypothetical protein K3495_g11506 [Podosphaera aphanis]|nr:hypothetical protein K3495_g11506 [Podosphaera aphanis]
MQTLPIDEKTYQYSCSRFFDANYSAATILRWGMDFTGPVKHGTFSSYLCTAIEYASSLGIVLLVNSTGTSGVIALFNLVSNSFDPPKQLIYDNGSAFVSVELKNYLINHGTSLYPTKPYRPTANRKVKKLNVFLKQIFLSVSNHPDYTKKSISAVLSKSLQILANSQSETIPYRLFAIFLNVRSNFIRISSWT